MSRPTKTFEEKIASKDEQILQLQNEKKRLIQQQKATERKERTRRLCSRHGMLEKYMPDLITITDEQFEIFIQRGIDTSYGQKILAELAANLNATGVNNGKTQISTVTDEEYESYQDEDENEDNDD